MKNPARYLCPKSTVPKSFCVATAMTQQLLITKVTLLLVIFQPHLCRSGTQTRLCTHLFATYSVNAFEYGTQKKKLFGNDGQRTPKQWPWTTYVVVMKTQHRLVPDELYIRLPSTPKLSSLEMLSENVLALP